MSQLALQELSEVLGMSVRWSLLAFSKILFDLLGNWFAADPV